MTDFAPDACASFFSSLKTHYAQVRSRLQNPPVLKRAELPTQEPDPRSCVTEEILAEPIEVAGEPERPLPAVLIEVERPIRTGINCRMIVDAVASYYRLSVTELTSERRASEIVRPRQVAMYLARILTVKSLPEIGRIIGGRDHTTVMSAVRRIESLMKTDADLAADIDRLISDLTSQGQEPANDNLADMVAGYVEKSPYWTPARIQELALMWARGDRISDVARHFQRSEPSVLRQIHRYNLKRSPVYQRTYGK